MPFDLPRTIARIFPLPPPDQRRTWPLVPTAFLNTFRLERDGDYLCYLAATIVWLIGFAVLAILAVDINFATGIILQPWAFQESRLALSEAFFRVMGPVAFCITAILYLRIRLAIDLKHYPIPITITREKFIGRKRRPIILSALGMTICLLFLSNNIPSWFIEHYSLQRSLSVVVIVQIIAVGCYTVCAYTIVSCALIFEKAVRFFPELKKNLEDSIAN